MSTFRREVLRRTGYDPCDAGVDELAATTRTLTNDTRQVLLSAAESALRNPRLGESNRVAAVKVTIALLPDSEALLERVLGTRDRGSDYENHFTLFCFLDVVQEIPELEQQARRIPRIVGNYLMSVRADTALAAWMASDLLGDHWHGDECIDILQQVLEKGRSSVARRAAVHGLAHRLSTSKGRSRVRITTALRNAERCDRNQTVRSYAHLVLQRPRVY